MNQFITFSAETSRPKIPFGVGPILLALSEDGLRQNSQGMYQTRVYGRDLEENLLESLGRTA